MGAGCFGKIPIHSEFLQHNASGPEVETLYRWFQAGMEKVRRFWGDNFAAEYRKAAPTRFLFRQSAAGNLVAGVWISSLDHEENPNPFLVFTQIPQDELEGRKPLLPLVLWDFLRKAEEVALGGWNGTSLDTFLFRVDDLKYTLDTASAAQKYRTYLDRKRAYDIWSALFGSFEDERKLILAHNLRTQLENGTPGIPMRLPLAPAVIASFWIDFYQRIAKTAPTPTLTAWNSNSLSLLFPEPEANHFPALIRPDLAHELGLDLAKSGRDDATFIINAKESFETILQEPGLPLSALLEKIEEGAPAAPVTKLEPQTEPVQEQPVQVAVEAPASAPEPVLKPVARPGPAPEPVLKPISRPATPIPPSTPVEKAGSDEGSDIHIAPRSEGLLKHSRYIHACYGKLPIFGDFIRDKNNLPEIKSMDIWFQEGILAARQANRNWDAEFTSGPTSRFLYASPDSRNLIAGVWIPSVDRAGRRYPFLIYTAAPLAELGGYPQLHPLFFSDFFHRAEALAEEGWKNCDLRGFGEKVDRLTYHKDFEAGRAAYEKYLNETTAGDLWRTLFGQPNTPATMLLPTNLQSSLIPMRTGSASNMKTALRFPRKKGVEPSLWIDLTMRMSGRTSYPTLTTWTDQSLSILYPNLSPRYYAFLMQPSTQGEAVAEVAKLGEDHPGTLQRAKERFGAFAAKPDINLGQMLRGLTGR